MVVLESEDMPQKAGNVSGPRNMMRRGSVKDNSPTVMRAEDI